MKTGQSPIYAAVFSFFLPGLGQYYNNELIKGAVFLLAFIALSLFHTYLGFAVNIVASIEAYLTSRIIMADGYVSNKFVTCIIILGVLFIIGFLWGMFAFHFLKDGLPK